MCSIFDAILTAKDAETTPYTHTRARARVCVAGGSGVWVCACMCAKSNCISGQYRITFLTA